MAAGALLSAHHMLMTNQHIMPGYDGSLLRFAVDLGDRLVPSFNTPYGVPLSWINLEKVGHLDSISPFLTFSVSLLQISSDVRQAKKLFGSRGSTTQCFS